MADSDQQELEVHRYNPSSGKLKTKTYGFAVLPYFSWTKVTENGSIYYADAESRLFCLENATTGQYHQEINFREWGYDECIPSNLSSDEDGNLYFNDLCTPRLFKYDERWDELELIYEAEDVVIGETRYQDLYDMRMMNGHQVALANSYILNDNYFFIENLEQTDRYIIDEKRLSIWALLLRFLLSAVIAFAAISVVYGLYRYFKKTRSIMVKQVFIMCVVLLLGMGMLIYGIRHAIMNNMVAEANFQIYTLANNLQSALDVDELHRMDLPMSLSDDFYDELETRLELYAGDYFDVFPDAAYKDLYYKVFLCQDEQSYLLVSAKASEIHRGNGMNEIYSESNSITEQIGESDDGHVSFFVRTGEGVKELFCRKNIEHDGEICGKVEVGLDYEPYIKALKDIVGRYMVMILAVNIAVLAALVLMVRRTLRGLGKLRDGVNTLSEGNYNTLVDINSNDELEEIGNAFNRMTKKTKSYLDSIERLNTAYERFIPSEIFGILGKESVMEVQRGDNVVSNMAVMTINTSNFSTIGEAMDSVETFAYFNRFYGTISSIVKKSGGVVEDYRGEGMRCVYGNRTDDCIDCALEILEMSVMDPDGARLNMIIQRDDIMFGIVGSEENYEVVAASGILNNTYVLQEIAKQNEIPLLVTLSAYERIEGKEKYRLRYLGKARSRQEESGLLELYEVLDAYSQEGRKNKTLTLHHFHRGVDLFMDGDFHEARKAFTDVIRIDKRDKMAQMYLFLCDEMMERKPEDWNGYFG